ncbi:hypothetical protein O7623_29600 [Solwaraspora sp. WMMD791]|uniref:hypothetical protein n=1 Tax=Solwaraspora sp. WMMD791 TaxID=3016086 RepID=UPI00249C1EF5|nr:hypothetical protein [Solwaraspora sp. WMMD791]WFE27333.1 hypothetical protein O7623_29600 [Solwaraspora sp. WMMD791]
MDPNAHQSDDADPRWYSERTYVDQSWQSSTPERYPVAPRGDTGPAAEPTTDRFGEDPLGLGGRYGETGRRAAPESGRRAAPETGRRAAVEPSSAPPYGMPVVSAPPFAPPGSTSPTPFAPAGSSPRPPFAAPVSAAPFAEPASGPPGTSGGSRAPDPAADSGLVTDSGPVAETGRVGEPRGSVDVPTGPMPPVTPRPPAEPPPPAGEYGRRPPSGGMIGDGVYRSRRPAQAIFYAVLVMILEVPALRLLLDGALAEPAGPGAVVAGTALMLGLPAFGLGMFGLTTGATKVGDPVEAWLRPPTAYLLVGLFLFLVAGLAG